MTMNNEKAFRVYRASEADPDGEKDWRRMRRGLAEETQTNKGCEAKLKSLPLACPA
jgi:hypothetical protein